MRSVDLPHVALEESLGDSAGPDLDVGEVVWRGKHQDGGISEVEFLLGELGFCWVEDFAVCCTPAYEVTGVVVMFDVARLGIPLDLGLDLFARLGGERSAVGHCCRGDGEGEQLADGEMLGGV